MLHGDSYDEAYARSLALAKREKLTFVHPYDDPDVIAGQGTIGMEILRQHSGADRCHLRRRGRRRSDLRASPPTSSACVREVKIIGVEPIDSDAMTRSLAAGHRVRLAQVGLFADGVAVKQVGAEPFRLCRKLVDDMILVDNDDICAAIKDVFEDTRSILEPAGALAIAGAKAWVERRGWKRRTLVAIACGANMNFDRLRFVAERAELGERREAVLAVTIPERPGQLQAFLLADRGAQHHRVQLPLRQTRSAAQVFVGVSIRTATKRATCYVTCGAQGLETEDLSDNEMAKLHMRHMVGGRSPAGARRDASTASSFRSGPAR